MPTPAGGSGGALDATVQAVDGAQPHRDEAAVRAQLLVDEADAALAGLRSKVDKLAAHLAGAKDALKDAEAAALQAAAHLEDVEGGGH